MRFRHVRGSSRATVTPGSSTLLPVATATGLPTVTGFSVNALVNARGRAGTWRVEYGATSAYGSSTDERELPPRLTAHFDARWDEAAGTAGFLGGIHRAQLSYQATGGPSNGPYVRYTDDGTDGNDTNHINGIGIIHLGLYFYSGHYTPPDTARFYLGGGFPDMRGARFSMWMRGNSWVPNGATIGTWVQGFREPQYVDLAEFPDPGRAPLRFPNWAYEGDTSRTAAAAGSTWTHCEWALNSRTSEWTFGGCNSGRLLYDYGEIDSLLSKVSADIFPVQILRTALMAPPSGSLDYADLRIIYRQHSLTCASNGGSLVSSPVGGTGEAHLTDGYRNGAGREWQSVLNPSGPQDFVYAFTNPVTLKSVTIHNATVNPSEGFEIAVSENGGTSWTTLHTGTLPTSSARGPNDLFYAHSAYVLDETGDAIWAAIHPNPVNRLRVRVTSGVNPSRWGLGEIEAHGDGASKLTERTPEYVSRDVVTAAGTYHYRVVVTTTAGTTYGPDQTVIVPAVDPPAPTYDPALLTLSGFWASPFTGIPWVGQSSAGLSGGRDLTDGGSGMIPIISDPLSLGGASPAALGPGFNGVDDRLYSDLPCETFLPASGYVALILYQASGPRAAAANVYDDPLLVGDGYGLFITHSNGGFGVAHYDGVYRQVRTAAPNDAWVLGKVRFDGTNIYVGTNGGPWSAPLAAGTRGVAGSLLQIGGDTVATPGIVFAGTIGVVALASSLSDSDINNFRNYLNSTFGLSV